MDFEEEQATQPCTQPLGTAKTNADDTTGILCVLFPTTPSARYSVSQLLKDQRNRNFVFIQHAVAPFAPNISIITTSDEQLEEAETTPLPTPEALSIALRFDPGPLDIETGFWFGRHPKNCDVILGDALSIRRVSNLHFRIFVNDQDILMLEDKSTNGTYVDGIFLGPPNHIGHENKAKELRPRSRQLSNGSEIHILKGTNEEEIRFMVRIPKSNGSGFLGDEEDFSTFDPNNLHQVPPTAGPIAYSNHTRNPNRTCASVPTNRLAVVQPGQQPWMGQNRFQFLEIAGRGAFAIVHRATVRESGELVAIKHIQRKKAITKNAGYEKEVEILERLKHPNIVSYYEFLEDDANIWIVMEYIGGGDLNDYINKHGRMEEHLVQEVTRQILRGVLYVHEMGVSHRDLKPDNILVSSEDPILVKLSDFGLAKVVRNEETFLKTFCGTMLYLAPEVFPSYHKTSSPVVTGSKRKHDAIAGKPKPQRRYTQAVDLWAIGVIVFTLLTGKPPFEGRNQDEVYEKILSGKYDVGKLRQVENQHCVDFISRLIEVDPALRMEEREALRHPWLSLNGSDSQFSSSMEVDEDLAIHYQRSLHAGDIKEESWEEVSPDSGEEGDMENKARRRKSESLIEVSEGEYGVLADATGGTQIKRLLDYNDLNSQNQGDFASERVEGDLSFDFVAHDGEGMLHSNGAGLLAFAQKSSQGCSSILPFQEFVSEGSIRTVTPHTVQVLSSQGKSPPGEASKNQNLSIHSTSNSSPRDMAKQAASNLEVATPVTMSPQPKILSSQTNIPSPRTKIVSPQATIAKSPSVDSQKTPTLSQNFVSRFMSDSVGSTEAHNLAETTILSSTNTSFCTMRPGPTLSQAQMPPPRLPTPAPTTSQSPAQPIPEHHTPARKAIAVKTPYKGMLDYEDRGTSVPADCWGKLVPLEDSLTHPTILCSRHEMVFGRRELCTLQYVDTRFSKKHCGIHYHRQRKNSKARVVLKCRAKKPCKVNGVPVPVSKENKTPPSPVSKENKTFPSPPTPYVVSPHGDQIDLCKVNDVSVPEDKRTVDVFHGDEIDHCIVNGVPVKMKEVNRTIDLFHGDEIVLFDETKTNEKLAFKLYLAKAYRESKKRHNSGDETTEAEKSSSSGSADSDALMTG